MNGQADARRYGTEASRWRAVLQRDPAADGCFVYSVRTTGVYCRPICPARRPLRRNVAFHTDSHEAETRGYRACKRCRPRDSRPSNGTARLVAQACRRMEESDPPPRLAELARAAGLSRYHFHRIFKVQTGVTPRAYAHACRQRRLRDQLDRPQTVSQAVYRAGYGSSGRFYASAGKDLGMRPTIYRAGGRGETIRFAVGQCWLGAILVAATDKGICAIALGEQPEKLVRDLQDRFPHAELVGGDRRFETWMARVVALVERPSAEWDLPLDIRGTAFQRRVWEALGAIPPGTTASYSQIARQMGRPQAARSVAGACAANALAVAIPCHRVVRTDGSLSGYRWGVERKRRLLEREAAAE